MPPSLEVIVGQSQLEKTEMAEIGSFAKILGVRQIIPFTDSDSFEKLIGTFDVSSAKMLVWGREKERRLRDILWEPSLGASLRGTPGIGLNKVVMIVGPDEDFSEKEVRQAVEAGFMPVGLGGLQLKAKHRTMYALSCIRCLLQ